MSDSDAFHDPERIREMDVFAQCLVCNWQYRSHAEWLVQRVADTHRGVWAHEVVVRADASETLAQDG